MKAVRLDRTGGPEVLQYVDVPTPVAAPGQVLVKAHAIGVNMPEVLLRRGTYPWMPPLPTIPGIEMSGVIAETGAAVSALRVGQPVFVSARELPHRAGCYAEYIAVPERAVYVLPEGVDLDAAAALSNYQVAYHLLHSATHGFPYESVLVPAAAGGVGSAIVQLARAASKRVIAVVRSKEKAEFALSLGAAVAFNDREGGLPRDVVVDLVLDPVGGPRFARLFDHLAPLGLLVLYGFLEGWPTDDVLAAMQRHFGRSPALRVFSMHTFDGDPEPRRRATAELLRMLRDGVIRPAIHARVPLAEAARAHTLLETGKVMGKLLLKP